MCQKEGMYAYQIIRRGISTPCGCTVHWFECMQRRAQETPQLSVIEPYLHLEEVGAFMSITICTGRAMQVGVSCWIAICFKATQEAYLTASRIWYLIGGRFPRAWVMSPVVRQPS